LPILEQESKLQSACNHLLLCGYFAMPQDFSLFFEFAKIGNDHK
jgi:hypothetical protein